MRKVFVIAARDYKAAVRTKSFVISLLIMPLMMGGSILVQTLVKNQVDTGEKRFAIVDRTPGQALYGKIESAARKRNETETRDPETGRQTQPIFALESVTLHPGEAIDEVRFALSERIRRKELFGFVDIGPEVLQSQPDSTVSAPDLLETSLGGRAVLPSAAAAVRYQSNRPTYDAFQKWLQ